MSQSAKDREAEAVVRSAIVHLIGEKAIDHVEVRPTEDQAGEPGLAVTIFLKAPRERMSGSLLLDAIAAAASALREIDDFRFPYVDLPRARIRERRGYASRRLKSYMWSLVRHQLENARLLATHDRRRPGRLRCGARCRPAYYAVFQALCAMCADTLVGSSKPWEAFTPVFRALEHSRTAHTLLQPSLATTAQLQRFGLAFKDCKKPASGRITTLSHARVLKRERKARPSPAKKRLP